MEVIGTSQNSNWFASLLRLLTLRRLDDLADRASDASIAACGAASLALWIIVDRLQWGRGVQFDAFGIPMLALIALLVLALAYLTARLSNPPQPMRCTLLMAVASLPLWIAVSALIDAYVADRWSTLAAVIFGAGVLLYAARSLRALSGRLQFKALGAGAALLAGYLWLGQLIDLHPSLWAPPANVDKPDSTMSVQLAESLLFEQRDRIDEALEAVADSDSDSDNGNASASGSRSSVFFVGFAGVASQKVFAEEIKLAAQVVGGRFDSASRQLLLINDQRDFDHYPLATVSGLHYALGELDRNRMSRCGFIFLASSPSA